MSICSNILDILNPSLYYRLWTVSVDGMHAGKVYSFWRKSQAIVLYKKVRTNYPEVTLRNELTKKVILKSDNWDSTLSNYVWPKQIDFESEFAKLP